MATKSWGFDIRNMDRSVRPQDDFYHYVNGGWIKKNKIPATEARWGSFNILRFNTEKELKSILTDLTGRRRLPDGSPEQMVRDMYRSAIDTKTRNAKGIEPLKPHLKMIEAVQTKKELLACLAKLNYSDVSVPWHMSIYPDAKNSSKYVLYLSQGGLGLPDREYYLKDGPEYTRVRTAYVPHVERMFGLIGKSSADAKRCAEVVMKVETLLARASMNKVDARDADKTYHKKTFAEFKRHVPQVDWAKYFAGVHIPIVPYLIVEQPEFFASVGKLFDTLSVDEWKTYLIWHTTSGFAPLLTQTFVKAHFDFYGRVLSGSKKMRQEWRKALSAVNGTLGEALGKIYIKRYFGAESKKKMQVLVNDLFEAYERRIKNLDWMGPATKRKALQKLKLIQPKIGYPTKWKSYKGLEVVADDYVGNALRASIQGHKREVAKLKKPIDRTEWYMYPQTVNAYYSPGMNEIVFPAAILQPPFFNFSADDAINYGAIGSVIGHEITHGFDDQGSKFDGKGNMKKWWTDSDRKRFEKKSKILIDQFNTFSVDGVQVNGKLTLGENIADLGGAAIAFDAFMEHLKKSKRVMIDGFTPEQRFFLGFAQQEQEIARDEFKKTAALTDPHSPAETRVNGPLANLTEFHEAFGVTKSDKLYRNEKQRAKIW